MIGYNPSHLNKNETLLEAFHRVEAYLKANPQYQVYQSSAQYQESTQEYTLDTIIVPEGSKVSAGDVVLFSNVYYAVITSVSETTFSIENATNFRGEKGDSGVGNANLSNTPGNSDTDGYTQKVVNGIVQNPNLLINPNFAINQRGQTSYTGAVYGVDRWKGVNANTVVTPQAVGIIVQGANFQFAQDIDNYAIIDGYTLTLSIKANGIVYSASGVYNKDVDYSFCTCVIAGGYVARIRSYQGTCRCQILGISSGEALSIEWVKLEVGSVATEFSPPSIAEELPKCQRYYQIRSNSYTIETSAIDRPIPMRDNGTIGTTSIGGVTYKYVDAEI